MSKKHRKLEEILYKAQVIEKEPLLEAMKIAKTSNRKLADVLLERRMIDEEILTKAIAKQHDMKYVDMDKAEIPPNITEILSEEIIRRSNVLPLGHNDGKLKIAISDPLDFDTLDKIRFRLNSDIECYLGNPAKIMSRIKEAFENPQEEEVTDTLKHSIDATAAELAEAGHELRAEALIAQAAGAGADNDAPIIKLINLIIDNAYFMNASDIHVEPMADRVRVRYRVDGVCLEKDNIPKNMQAPMVTRLQIMAGMDIAEKRMPQDGRIKRNIGGQDIDFRVSSLPGYHGPSVVLRILRPDAVNIGIQALGFENDDYERFKQIIKRPNGIFLVTGPTGSGKTTTLYAALQELNRPDKKIITAEDPVEYNFAGMNQCQVREDIGFSFDKILRSMLRQAPNIILVGEIRDGEVADIAIQAALTGHLVFSTLHTNDAPSAITRLIDMGVKPFLAASSIQAIMAQRLVRVICKNCKTVDENPDMHQLKLLDITPEQLQKNNIYKGAGCSKCHGTGYKGRRGVFEMFELNNEIRELAFAKAPSTELRKAAIAGGMKTLMQDGIRKIFSGLTTPLEIARIAQADNVVVDS